MNRNIVCFSFLLFCFFASLAFAQESLVKFPTGDAAWTVAVTYPASPLQTGTNPSRIQKVEVACKDGVRQNRVTWSNGRTTESWHVESLGIQLYEDPQNLAVYVVSKNDPIESFYVTITYDESFFEWITPVTFKGKETYEGKKCLRYEGLVAPKPPPAVFGSGSSNALPPRLYKAWIEEATLLPVALDDSISLNIFTFKSAPTETLVMPEKIKDKMKIYQNAITPPRPPLNAG